MERKIKIVIKIRRRVNNKFSYAGEKDKGSDKD
ncbi:hypothetical protein ES703_17968 [subsurface metagenome]